MGLKLVWKRVMEAESFFKLFLLFNHLNGSVLGAKTENRFYIVCTLSINMRNENIFGNFFFLIIYLVDIKESLSLSCFCIVGKLLSISYMWNKDAPVGFVGFVNWDASRIYVGRMLAIDIKFSTKQHVRELKGYVNSST